MTRRKKLFELECGQVRERLSPLLDGEASPSEAAAVGAHLDECVDCAVHFHELRLLHTRLGEELTDACDEEQIWERVEWAIAAHETSLEEHAPISQPEARRPVRSAWHWAAPALAAMLLIGVIFGGQNLLWRNGHSSLPVVTETVRDFETFRLRGSLLDVTASEPGAVRKWMAAKIDFQLPENVGPPAGFKVAGGRLCSFLNRRLAFFHYKSGPSAMSLYVMKASGLSLPQGGAFDTTQSNNKLTTVTWRQGDLAYVVVSDLPANDVTAFASQLRAQPSAPGETRL